MYSGLKELHRFVSSISIQDYRMVKAHVKRVGDGENQKWVDFMDFIRDMGEKLDRKAISELYPNKNQRYQIIKNCFNSIGEVICTIKRVKNKSHLAQIFIYYGVWNKAYKLLDDAIEDVLKVEHFVNAHRLLDLQLKTIKHLFKGDKLNQILADISKLKRKVSALNLELESVEQSLIQYEILANNLKTGQKVSAEEWKSLLLDLPDPTIDLKGTKAKFLVYKIRGVVGLFTGKAIQYEKNMMNSFHQFSKKWMQDEYPEDFYRISVIAINAVLSQNDHSQAKEILNRIKECKLEETPGSFYMIEFKLKAVYIMAENLFGEDRIQYGQEYFALFETWQERIEQYCEPKVYAYLAMLYVDLRFMNQEFEKGNLLAGNTIARFELSHPVKPILPLLHLIGLFELDDLEGIDSVKGRYRNMIIKDVQFGEIGRLLFSFLSKSVWDKASIPKKAEQLLVNLDQHKDSHMLSLAFSILDWIATLKGIDNNED